MNERDHAAISAGYVLSHHAAIGSSYCYRCGNRMYYAARHRALGLCMPCEKGLDYATMDPQKAIGANLRAVSWSPYEMPTRPARWVVYPRDPTKMESIR